MVRGRMGFVLISMVVVAGLIFVMLLRLAEVFMCVVMKLSQQMDAGMIDVKDEQQRRNHPQPTADCGRGGVSRADLT